MDNLLSVEEVRNFLEVKEEELQKWVQKGKLQAYKIGGTYLRFRKEDVLALHQELHPSKKANFSIPFFARIGDFWKFNNFYILSLLLIGVLLFIVIRS